MKAEIVPRKIHSFTLWVLLHARYFNPRTLLRLAGKSEVALAGYMRGKAQQIVEDRRREFIEQEAAYIRSEIEHLKWAMSKGLPYDVDGEVRFVGRWMKHGGSIEEGIIEYFKQNP